VYAARGKNFLLTMLRLACERDGLRVGGDQFGCPTPARLIAEATAQIVARGAARDGSATLNLASGGQASWAEFAAAIVDGGAARGLCKAVPVEAITTADYPTPAKRPAWSALDPDALAARFDVRLPHWSRGLDLVLDERAAYKV